MQALKAAFGKSYMREQSFLYKFGRGLGVQRIALISWVLQHPWHDQLINKRNWYNLHAYSIVVEFWIVKRAVKDSALAVYIHNVKLSSHNRKLLRPLFHLDSPNLLRNLYDLLVRHSAD